MGEALQTAIASQRMLLRSRLSARLDHLAKTCRAVWSERQALEDCLVQGLEALPYCKYLYILDNQARQITANISHGGPLPENFGRDRSERPYMAEALKGEVFSLSNAYISRNARRPTLTAVQRIEDAGGRLLGYLGADFDLRELPLTREVYEQPESWMQIKGDPAIRSGLFMQQRVESAMDRWKFTACSTPSCIFPAPGPHSGWSTIPSAIVFWILRTSPILRSAWPGRSAATPTMRSYPRSG